VHVAGAVRAFSVACLLRAGPFRDLSAGAAECSVLRAALDSALQSPAPKQRRVVR
jgi:hypothetical protein